MRLLLIFLAAAVVLGCRDALAMQRGGTEIGRRWPLIALATVVAVGYLSRRLLE
jgi:hypothetical protein